MIIDLSKINFGGGGGSDIKVQDVKVVTQNVDSSGSYDFQPDEGYDAMKAVKANLTIPSTPVQTVDLDTGIKFSNSLFATLPFQIKGGSGLTTFDNLFYLCKNLTAIDLSEIDTSNALVMNYMFASCYKLTSIDLSNLNTEKVTNLSNMFEYSRGLIDLDLSHFNTTNVIHMGQMFYGCSKLATLDISYFDMTKTTNYSNMFKNCNSLTTVKVINCDETTKNKILTQLQTDLSSYTWTLGEDGIITRSETT